MLLSLVAAELMEWNKELESAVFISLSELHQIAMWNHRHCGELWEKFNGNFIPTTSRAPATLFMATSRADFSNCSKLLQNPETLGGGDPVLSVNGKLPFP